MLRPWTILSVLLAVSPLLADRTEALFNRDFRFALGEKPAAEAAAPGFDDAKWDRIGLPHSFSIPYFRSPHFVVDEGWYRKKFPLPALPENRRVRLDFEAAFQHCEVFVNGQKAGGHDGGYTGFSVDLTPYLKAGENTLAIRVDNKWQADLPPRAGEHVFSGGIYRDVRIVETDALHVPRNGLKVTTPEVSRTAARVQPSLRVKNADSAKRDFRVVAELISPAGVPVARTEAAASLAPGDEATVTPSALTVANPKLWSPESPALYRTRVSLIENGKVTDSVSVRTGLRRFKFDKEKGFFLNGEHLRLRGANRHQDHAGWGDAVANTAHYRDAWMIKDCGMNFVRGSHYPHDPAFLDACDELGLLVWSENTFWGIGGFGKDGYWTCSAYPPGAADQPGFEANDKRLLGEMIDDLGNHPSILVWSLSNEPFFTDKSVMEKAKAHLRDMVDESHRLDPTRPVGVGGAQRAGFDKIGDIIGYNGDGAGFPKPDRPSLVAEYGSRIEDRPGKYDPAWGDTKGEKPEWRAGEALWCAFHHGSIAGDMGRMGMIDYFRLPLRRWYWYRNEYAKVPPPEWPKPGRPAALKLSADRLTLSADGTQDSHLVVTVLGADGKPVSDSPDVTLAIVAGPGELPTGPAITFRHGTDIDIRDGLAAIAFRSWHAGKTLLRATSPGLKPAEIELVTAGAEPWQSAFAAEWQKSRAYRAKPVSEQARRESRDNLAFIRPTRVSSQESKNPSDQANDGDPQTRWCAANGSTPAFWQVDLENFYAVEKVQIHLEKAGAYRYRVEISIDNENWKNIAEAVPSDDTAEVRTHAIADKPRARFLRVTFTGTPKDAWPSLREVKVSGTQAD